MTGLIRSAFKKDMCFFVLFFSSSMLFFGRNIQKVPFYAFLGQKCAFFSVEPLIFSGKYDFSEGFEHKEVKFFFKIVCTVLIFGQKIFGLASLGIKFTLICNYCPCVSLDMMKMYRHNDWI